MWKNLKMTSKLMLGFGLLLSIFVAAVVVTWDNLSSMRTGSEYLSNEAMPSLSLGIQIERQAYELFLSVKDLQFTESDEALADSREWIAKLDKTLKDIEALGAANPSLPAPKKVKETVVPAHKSYVDNVNAMHAAIEKKDKAYVALTQAGTDAVNSIAHIKDSFYELAQTEVHNGDVMAQRLQELSWSFDILQNIQALMIRVRDAVMNDDVEALNTAMGGAAPIIEVAQKLQESIQDPKRKAMMDTVFSTGKTYVDGVAAYVQALKEMDDLTRARNPLMKSYNKGTSDVSEYVVDSVKSVSGENRDAAYRSGVVLLLSAGLGVALGVVISFLISRSIAKPLNAIVGAAKRCQDGDLTLERQDFGYEGKDELGRLSDALSSMVNVQESAMREVVTVARELAQGADGLSSIAEETNASMEEIKASIDQVTSLSESNGQALEQSSAGVRELSSGADTVAKSATDSAAFISQTTHASSDAVQTVNDVIKGMRDVGKNSKESADKIQRLVSSVENVSSFVSVITGIADQTNLLALNAAIEAARAGEAGRGFAVVAEEVRKLAEESARAAQNVNGIIVELQKGAQESISATNEADRMLNETLSNAQTAQQKLADAMEEINKTNESIQNIAAVAQEQAASSREAASAIEKASNSATEMVKTIEQIRHAAEGTARAAEGVANRSDAMNGHSQSLTKVLSRFQLHGADVLLPKGTD
jgi:methyl-accepting chemotaxis protein